MFSFLHKTWGVNSELLLFHFPSLYLMTATIVVLIKVSLIILEKLICTTPTVLIRLFDKKTFYVNIQNNLKISVTSELLYI